MLLFSYTVAVFWLNKINGFFFVVVWGVGFCFVLFFAVGHF